MNIVRVYAKFLPLNVIAVRPSLTKIFLNAPTHYTKFNTQEINIKNTLFFIIY